MENYQSAIDYIHSFGHGQFLKRPLSRTRELLSELGSPDRSLKFVHVAGTNGKGSVCAMLESILRCAGFRTGMFTSPFITRFNERIRVNGENIPDEDLASLVEEIRPVIDRLCDKPTEFELVTVLGLLYFFRKRCDIVVLEAGMGGRFDFTNVIDAPEVSIITSIGYEHVKNLGPTLSDIAWHKAGIIKRGCGVIFSGAGSEAKKVILEEAERNGADVIEVRPEEMTHISSGIDGSSFSFGRFQRIRIPLAGAFQLQNAAVAVSACELLKKRGWEISDDAVLKGLNSVEWKGRLEKLGDKPLFILDGAHNPPAAAAFKNSVKPILGARKAVVIIGVMEDKDARGIIDALRPIASQFICVPVNSPRAMAPEKLSELIGDAACPVSSVEEGVGLALKEAGESGAVCALGSLYLSEDVRRAVYSL
ncbi:MAG: bifunctional folylpolyglutamate synthase/dihydrofolate synthase [Oscillospiraceae bacterium]|nr:bifunctional folylpolyglutamate synthase/dihydrofolate synthase [Oscillospiraceae bacterium]